MKRQTFLRGLAAAVLTSALVAALPARADENIVVISHSPLKGVDAEVLRRIYTGRTIELDRLLLHPVNLAPGHPLRRRFAGAVLQQSDDDYIAYWTVRRYIGKGAPPRELSSTAEIIEYVTTTPGAIGYIEASELKPSMFVVLRR